MLMLQLEKMRGIINFKEVSEWMKDNEELTELLETLKTSLQETIEINQTDNCAKHEVDFMDDIKQFCEESYSGARAMDDSIPMYAFSFALAWIDTGLYEKEIVYQVSYFSEFFEFNRVIFDEYEALQPAEFCAECLQKNGYKEVKIQRVIK